MVSHAKRVPLDGSHRPLVDGSQVIGPLHPDERIEVTIRIRPRAAISPETRSLATSYGPASSRSYLTHDQMAALHGASPEDIAAVASFGQREGLTVVHTSSPRRSVWLSGTIAQLSAAFGVELTEYSHPVGGSFRGRTGPVMIPEELAGVIVGVFGLDNRPQAKPHFRRRTPKPGERALAGPAAGLLARFTPPQVASLYNFPPNLDGTGECIAIIELGGGFNTRDLNDYFSGLGLTTPSVSSVSVDKGSNRPTGNPDGPDGEVMLDVEIAGAIAPKARIVVYFTSNTSQGFLDAITQAVHDTVHKPSVISISWGGPETSWTGQAFQQFDQAFQAAVALGITVCVASGDDGSSDGVDDGQAHVDFPASSPNVLACGGTTLQASATQISAEVVWDTANDGATGGGVSTQFPLPDYQKGAGVPASANNSSQTGRGVPDVAADADPATGYTARVDGENTVVGGTSAVAPLWAGLIARLNQGLGKPVGFLNPLLYGQAFASGVFRDVTSGTNGAYSAGPGWDACSGLGVADGTKLQSALPKAGS